MLKAIIFADDIAALAPRAVQTGLNLLDVAGEQVGLRNIFVREGAMTPPNMRSVEQLLSDFEAEWKFKIASPETTQELLEKERLAKIVTSPQVAEIKDRFLQKVGVDVEPPPANWSQLYGSNSAAVELRQNAFDTSLFRVAHPADLDDPKQVFDYRKAVTQRHMANIFADSRGTFVTGMGQNLYEVLSDTIAGEEKWSPIAEITAATNKSLTEMGSPPLDSKARWLYLTGQQKSTLVDRIAESKVPIRELTPYEAHRTQSGLKDAFLPLSRSAVD